MPGGATRVAAVVGSPIRHSLSPALFNAAFAATGLDWTFVAFEVGVDRAADLMSAATTVGLAALSVTMPLKSALAELVDSVTPTAEKLGAVNSIRFTDAAAGDNFDGIGLLDALHAEAGVQVTGRRCVVIGAGGAARAVTLALGDAGAAEVVVVNRTAPRAVEVAALAGAAGRAGDAAAIADGELVINATSVGMAGTPAAADLPFDAALLRPTQVVVDLVYHPLSTPLLAAAAAAGATTVGGLGMLVHQAGHQFRWWTGQEPPLAAMRAAAEEVIAAR